MDTGPIRRRFRLDRTVTAYRGGADQIAVLGDAVGRRPAVAVVDAPVARRHADRLARGLRDADGRPLPRLTLPGGERVKTFAALERLCRFLARRGLTRNGVVVAVGGGAVLDLAGLAASLWARGVAFVAAPTTLLAAVDAAVGGKTAIDLDRLKNPLGSFHAAEHVIVDTALLGSLPRREWRCGAAETVKAAVIGAPSLFRSLESRADALRSRFARGPARARVPDALELPWNVWIDAAVRVKGRIVTADYRETGPRRALNLGHTLGHALELTHGLAHGEAVALGTAAAARLAAARGICPARDAARIVALLDACGLPTSAAPPPLREVAPLVRRDKKARGGSVSWVLPRRIGAVAIDARVDLREMLAALAG